MNEVVKRSFGGNELAKVLIYYGLIGDISSDVFNIICPFHNDINPSMRVNLSDGSFVCFGCGLTGNCLDFVKYVNPELNELSACLELERILKSDKVRELKITYKKKKRKHNKQALIEAYDYFYGLKSVDWHNIENEEMETVLQYMKQRGFDERALNIADCRTSYNIAYPFLFPILDNGKFKGWVGRTTNKYTEKKRKYLYNDGFYKRDTLCGNYTDGCVPFICEGFFDYLSIRTKGNVKNTVALLGWHMSDDQLKKLQNKNITTVVSALDNDQCGEKGTKLLERYFQVIRFQFPVGVKDAGEMTREQIKRSVRKARKEINEIKN